MVSVETRGDLQGGGLGIPSLWQRPRGACWCPARVSGHWHRGSAQMAKCLVPVTPGWKSGLLGAKRKSQPSWNNDSQPDGNGKGEAEPSFGFEGKRSGPSWVDFGEAGGRWIIGERWRNVVGSQD